MENMKTLQLSVSVPFSYRLRKDPLSGIQMTRYPERETVYRYFIAMLKEIENCSGELDDVKLGAIRFIGGGIHFFWQKDLRQIMQKLFACFKLDENVELVSYGEPGQMTAGPCAVLKEYGFRQIVDIPSFSMTECQKGKTAYKGGQSVQKYEELGIPILGLRTSMGLAVRTESEWKQQTEGILRMNPEIIELTDRICPQDPEQEQRFFERMQAEGYSAVNERLLTRGYIPKFCYKPQGEYLGVGLDAVCRLDGYLTQNTGDLARYIECADDFSKLYQRIEKA